MNKQRLHYLFQLYFDKTASQQERDELFQYLNTASDEEIAELMKMVYEQHGDEAVSLLPNKRNEILSNIFSKTQTSTNDEGREIQRLEASISKKTSYKRYLSVAAILIVGISIGLLLYQNYFLEAHEPMNLTQQDIEPGGNRAVLILGNGQTIDLENTTNGKIANEKGVIISKAEEGEVVYELPDLKLPTDRLSVYNTIKTPRGGQYKITLPDGSKVWLNAESSLTYPTTFKTERRVKLIGEAYFEVAKDANAPFIVMTDQQLVNVLGTKFNINSYRDNDALRTTLIEGSVQVTNAATVDRTFSTILRPGEESVVNSRNQIRVGKVDPDQAIAWKNGLFRFENTDIKQVMREFSRWYAVDVEFDGPVPDIKLWGRVYRNATASEALDILAYFNLHYRIENNGMNKKIIISEHEKQ